MICQLNWWFSFTAKIVAHQMTAKFGYRKMNDMELVAHLADRDHAAFTEIYNRHWRSVFVYARSILKDQDEATDVVQDVFTTLWNLGAQLQITRDLKAYLLTAARNQSLKVIGKTTRADQYAAELAKCFNDEAGTTDDQLIYRELCTMLDEAIGKLPVTMQAVYRKSKDEELSHRSIAAELGITEHSSRTILNRAVNSLRTKLAPLLSLMVAFLPF